MKTPFGNSDDFIADLNDPIAHLRNKFPPPKDRTAAAKILMDAGWTIDEVNQVLTLPYHPSSIPIQHPPKW